MIFLWCFYWIPVGFPWYFCDISLGLLLDFYGLSMVFPWGSYGGSKGCLPLDSCGISMIFLWDYYVMSIESKLKSTENKFKLN